MNQTTSHKSRFFFYYSLILMLLVYAGFIGRRILMPESITRSTILIDMHGLFNGAWFLLLVIQTWLIGANHRKLHKNLGQVSILLVIAIVTVAVFMILDLYGDTLAKPEFLAKEAEIRKDLAQTVWLFYNWALFVYFYIHAIIKRKAANAHKRLMLFSALVMAAPGFSRLLQLFELPGIMTLLIMTIFMAAIWIYDWRKLGKPQGITVWSTMMVYSFPISFFTIATSQWWGDFVQSVLG